MENLILKVKDNTLTITIDLSVPGRPSNSGRSTVIACSGGNIPLITPDGEYRVERLNLTVSKPIPQEELPAWPDGDMAAITEQT
jgi:hypothetical protein